MWEVLRKDLTRTSEAYTEKVREQKKQNRQVVEKRWSECLDKESDLHRKIVDFDAYKVNMDAKVRLERNKARVAKKKLG